MGEPHGPWRPLGVSDVASLFKAAPFTWFIAGGHALELALGRSWRDHSDIDVVVRRDELRAVHAFLADWDLHVAAAGGLSPWDGRALTPERHEHNIWARPAADSPWQLDLIVGGGTDAAWRSRRDPSVRVPWSDAVRRSGGTPYLAPHVQLLMKSKDVRPKDDLDARVVLPTLARTERQWLAAHLPSDHPWHDVPSRYPPM